MNMNKNTKCVVKISAPHHAERVGYFQFFGEGESSGTAVFTDAPVNQKKDTTTFFAVKDTDFEVMS
jgi:hypothetical protein